MRSVLAVDMGSKYIKMVYGKKNKSGISIMDFRLLEASQVTDLRDCLDNVQYIRSAISKLIREMDIKSKGLVIGIRGNDIITRHVKVPFMAEYQLSKASILEIQQYLPINQKDYTISSKKIREVKSGNRRIVEVLVTAVPNKRVLDYYNAAKSLGLELRRIDLFSNSISRFFGKPGVGRCIALLDIGYSSSSLILLEDGKFLLDREIPVGSKDICDGIKSSWDTRALERLGNQIVRVFDFYSMNGNYNNVNILYLYGGGSMIEHVVEDIGSIVDVKTQLFPKDLAANIWSGHSEICKDMSMYLNCISLLM